MPIAPIFRWYRHPTATPTTTDVVGEGPDYVSEAAYVGQYVHREEYGDGTLSGAKFVSNSKLIVAAGEVFTPSAGRIMPIQGSAISGVPIEPWEMSEGERQERDAELASEEAFHAYTHAASNQTAAVKSGLWSDATTWSNGLPTKGAAIHIGSAYSVTADTESDVEYELLMVHGTLRADRTKHVKIIVDTIHVMGLIDFGTPDDWIPESPTLGKARANIQYKRVIAPGSSFRLGMMTMGRVRLHGAPKTVKGDFQNIAAGQRKAVAKDLLQISGWRVGDKCVKLSRSYAGWFNDPFYKGPKKTFNYQTIGIGEYDPIENFHGQQKNSHDEVVTITAINGLEVTFDKDFAFAANAIGFRAFKNGSICPPLPARIMNMSRSVRFEPAPGVDLTDNQQRAHTMFMYCDNVIANFCEFYNMGRTDTDPTLFIPPPPLGPQPMVTPPQNGDVGHPYYSTGSAVWSDSTRTVNLANPVNVRGRYPLHFHGMGPRFDRYAARCIGNSVWAGPNDPPIPGWAITHHNSRVFMHFNNVYRVRGAGIVSELGTEAGQWTDNTVAWCLGDGAQFYYNARQRNVPNHNGHSGVAYENQARQLFQIRNEFTSCMIGWGGIVQWTPTFGIPRAPEKWNMRLRDPLIEGPMGAHGHDDMTAGVAQPQIPDLDYLDGNDCQSPFRVEHRNMIVRNDPTPMRAFGWRIANTEQGPVMENYTWNYIFVHCAFKRAPGTNSPYTNLATRTGTMGWIDCIIEGWPQIQLDRSRLGAGFVDISTDGVLIDLSNQPIPNKNSASFPNGPSSFVKATDHPEYSFGLDWYEMQNEGMIAFSGTLTDSTGPRPWPDVNSGEDGDIHTYTTKNVVYKLGNGYSGFNLVNALKTNGCFQSGGNWFMPLWFGHVDWGNGNYFQWRVDVPLTNFPADVLAKYTVDPNAAKPQLPLEPEDWEAPLPTTGIAPALKVGGLAPKIDRAAIVENTSALFEGEWTGKPNDVDWFSYQWKQGSTVIAKTREYTWQAADIGVETVGIVTAHSAFGDPVSITTAAVTPVAAPTLTPDTILGTDRTDWWSADMKRIYPHGVNTFDDNNNAGIGRVRKRVTMWKGGKAGTQLSVYPGLQPTYERRGWWDGSPAIKFNGTGGFRDTLGSEIGTGNEPMHFWFVIERPNEDQFASGAYGDQKYVAQMSLRLLAYMKSPAGDPSQNKLWVNNFAPVTFNKGDRAVLYMGINSVGNNFGWNGVIVNDNAGPITNGNREWSIGNWRYGVDGGARVRIKAIEASKRDIITPQMHADMQAYLAARYL